MPDDVRKLFRIVFSAALPVVFLLALMPAPDVPVIVREQDKIGHFAAFLVLAVLGFGGWPNRSVAVCAGLLLYGLAIEVGQSLTAHRYGDPWDWVADAIGVGAGVALKLLRERSRRL